MIEENPTLIKHIDIAKETDLFLVACFCQYDS